MEGIQEMLPLCFYPGCKNAATNFMAGTTPGDVEPSQWCDEHIKFVDAFNKGKFDHITGEIIP